MKSLISYITPRGNKRLKTALSFGIANLVILVALAFFTDHEIMAIGGALAAVNTPIYAYMFAETKRPSNTVEEIENDKQDDK